MIRLVLVPIAILLFTAGVSAEPAESFEQAQELSVQAGKPILLEFVHED